MAETTETSAAGAEPGERADILIAGAGYVGLTLAVAIKSAEPSLDVRLVDIAPDGVWRKDERASAIAAAAIRMLDQLDIWASVKDEAQPITEMIVTDSRTNDVVRPVFLTFGGEAEPGEPFAHMLSNQVLNGALRDKAAEIGVTIEQGVGVSAVHPKSARVDIDLTDGRRLAARLLVACDGVNSKIRTMAGIQTIRKEYDQAGIVATVSHERPHGGRAEEHFLPSGPFAILPLKGNRSSLVWTESTRKAQDLVDGDEMVFELELEQRFGHKLGAISLEGGRKAFPLSLTLARSFVKPRIALCGDAAHGIHPIAGQGLNLGFKDAAALAQTIVEAERGGLDIGAIDVLEEYQRWRRFDTVQMGVTTDILNRLFSNDSSLMRSVRSFGLSLVDRAPPLKEFFISQAAGLTKGPSPRLLQGEPI
ncbi:ubiquinone biosynthesis hydroxylase [Fulvimarina sp. MAC3]|uniref:ubiquinone biosynthesis hydroxylase n=1 Tax=Fulvimarina sp. MAC3 TaxID=3148887 RepID=UPI0031FBB2D4